MAFFFGDGFDLYALPQDAAANYWDPTSNAASCSLVAGRFSGSRALNTSGAPFLSKTSNVNDGVHHFNFAYMQLGNTTSANIGFYVALFDGATAQCSVAIRGDGVFILTAGNWNSGSLLAIYPGAITVGNVWVSFEVEVVIHNTAGSITVRKNGNPNNDFFLGSLNTRASANNYANKISVGYAQNIGVSIYIDDFLWRSDVSALPWIGDIRCYTRRPVSDVTVQFLRTSTSINSQLWSGVNVQQSLSAGTGIYMQFLATFSGLLTGVTFGPNSNGGTGHIKAALFSVNGNVVGSVLAVATEVTNPVVGFSMTFPTPAHVVAGQTYWLGVIEDSGTIALNVVNNPAGCLAIFAGSTPPYASWPASNPGGALTSGNIPGMAVTITPQFNADVVGEFYQDAAISYVYSATNGQADLYAIGGIGTNPMVTYGVTTRGLFLKSDAGTRNATVQLKSGAVAAVQGPNTALNTAVWSWIARNDLVDPATGVLWTATAVNNVNVGPVVTA